MLRTAFIFAACLIIGGLLSPSTTADTKSPRSFDDIRKDIDQAVDGMVAELNEIGSIYAVPAAEATTGDGCVEIDIELPDTAYWESPYGFGMAQSYFELTNCGDEAAVVQLGFSITISISYLIDTTFYIPPLPIWLGAGETIVHECVFPVPAIEGTVTVCARAATGGSEDSDCASMVITGLGTEGVPIDAYGVLLQGTGCIVFAPAGDSAHLFFLDNYGEFGVGDTVHVTGNLIWDCDTYCPEAVGCIINTVIEAAYDPGMPFESCGYLVAAQSCILFIPAVGNNGQYDPADTSWQMILTIENYGEYQPGDSVFVAGTLIMQNDPNCPQAVGTVLENTIGPCDEWPPIPYEACGVLIQGAECVLFSPLANFEDLFVLDNYGSFEVGDTVLVQGFLVTDCITFCQQGNGCIVDNTIEFCDTTPPVPYEGCGLLVPYDNCIAFMPLDTMYVYYILENYGTFGVGDTVFVQGYIDGFTAACSLQLVPLIVDNTIDYCNVPIVPYEGCGLLMQVDNCLLFHPETGDTMWFVAPMYWLENYGDFGEGDTVYVNGMLEPGCSTECTAATGCVYENTIERCEIPTDTIYYGGCGVLMDDTGCVIFHPFDYGIPPAVLSNYGVFQIGDTVFVEGAVVPDCGHMCDYGIYVCMFNDVIDTCGGSPPPDSGFYSGCGMLVDDSDCVIFHPFEPIMPPAVLNDYGSFTVGDSVFVEGVYFADCYDICDNDYYVCLFNEIIESCGGQPPDSFYYAGCGVLVDDSGCIFFYPEDNLLYRTLLTDYGSFGIGDSVYVEGLVMLDPMNGCECLGVMYPCLYNQIIDTCNCGPPPDSGSYSGCGMLVDDSDCVIFHPFEPVMPPAVLNDYGSFGVGDSVFVEGTYFADCYNICDKDYYVCLLNEIIESCGGSPPPDSGFYSGCGMLVDDSECVIFHPFEPIMPPAVLNDYGVFNVGDTVFVEGTYFADCYDICDNDYYVCLFNEIIEACGDQSPDSFYYAGCGVLVDDTGCIFFYPEDGSFPKTLLTDYGQFSIGDSVYVEGLVMLDPMNGCECLGIMFPCLYNSVITECNGTPGLRETFEINSYPNPFNPIVNISFYLPTASNVTLKVYNILGQEVETLIDGEYLNGQCNVEWDGSYHGSGVYFYRIDTENDSRTGKMMLAK